MMNRQVQSKQQAIRKLDRRNAIKNIDYRAATSSSATSSSATSSSAVSFRVEGVDGDFDLICRSLGLSGPEDFAIPAAAWEARKSPQGFSNNRNSKSCELGSNRNSEKFGEGVDDKISEKGFDNRTSKSCELAKNLNLKSCVLGSNCNSQDTVDDKICEKGFFDFRTSNSYELVNDRNLRSCELGSNCNSENLGEGVDGKIFEKGFDYPTSKFCELANNGNLKSCGLDSYRNSENLGDFVDDKICEKGFDNRTLKSCESANSRNLENFGATGSNRDGFSNTVEANAGFRENEGNENRSTKAETRVIIRNHDEVKCDLGNDQNLERFGTVDTNWDNKSSKSDFFPAKIEVMVRRADESRDCNEGLSVTSVAGKSRISVRSFRSGGIKGDRPPLLAPPPVISPTQITDNTSSSWDLLRSFGPPSDEEKETTIENGEWLGDIRVISESCSDTSEDKDDDFINMEMEPLHFVSPLGKFKGTINSWQKGDFLGSGSFGTVYEGFTDDGIFFAVKEVSLLDQGDQGKQSIYQLEQEIFFLSQFEHENIVQYLGTDKDNGKLYIFLELVTKGSLASLYQKYNLQDSQVSAYTRQILNGLNYLHLRKVVHRDIKCANILVDASGSVKLADFGLAKATNLNDVKSCKGTAFWMAPEVVNRKSHGYGLAADIWSLGCTVLEMLTRRIPYSHLEGMQALFRIGKGEPPLVPDSLSRDARDFISKCLRVNPADRPTAAQLLNHPFVKRPLATFSAPVSPFHQGRRS